MEGSAMEIQCGVINSEVKSEGLIRGNAGVSMEMARDESEEVRTYNSAPLLKLSPCRKWL